MGASSVRELLNLCIVLDEILTSPTRQGVARMFPAQNKKCLVAGGPVKVPQANTELSDNTSGKSVSNSDVLAISLIDKWIAGSFKCQVACLDFS